MKPMIYNRSTKLWPIAMMTFIIHLSLLITAQAQLTLGTGVVNTYQAVSAVSGSNITLTGAASGATHTFAAGDRVLLVQMTGNTAANGGKFEFVTLAAGTTATTLVSTTPIARAYSPATEKVQVVWVPYNATSITVPAGGISAKKWDGTTGGIVAVLTPGTLTLNGPIKADGAGFRFADGINTINGNDIYYGGGGGGSEAAGGGGGGGYGSPGTFGAWVTAYETIIATNGNLNGGSPGGVPQDKVTGGGGGGAGVGGAGSGGACGPHGGGGGGGAGYAGGGKGGNSGDSNTAGGSGSIGATGDTDGTDGTTYAWIVNGTPQIITQAGGGGGNRYIGGGGGNSRGGAFDMNPTDPSKGGKSGSNGGNGSTEASGTKISGDGGGTTPMAYHQYQYCDGSFNCPDTRIWMAGGGQNTTQGGGIVMASAANIVSNNQTISSNGDVGVVFDATLTASGGGGGGGGGLLVINTQAVSAGTLSLCAKGGQGAKGLSDAAHGGGSGGSGGGGLVWVQDPMGGVGRNNATGTPPAVANITFCIDGGAMSIATANPKSSTFTGVGGAGGSGAVLANNPCGVFGACATCNAGNTAPVWKD